MAPAVGDSNLQVGTLWVRAPQDETENGGAPSNTSTYVAVGVTVGGILVILAVFILVKIVRKRRAHKREMEVLEAQSTDHAQNMREAIRPISHIWGPVPAPGLRTSGGWDLLSSNETLNQPQTKRGRRHRSIGLPRRVKQSSAIRLKGIKHLSAIVESPTIRSSKPTSPQQQRRFSKLSQQEVQSSITVVDDVFKPRPQTVHDITFNAESYASNAPDNSANDVQDATSSYKRLSRPLMHTRSFSLGAPPTKPPTGPVPPVPGRRSANGEEVTANRQGVCLNRLSSESAKSTSSSVLVTSPLIARGQQERKNSSPTLEQTVAEDENARIKVTRTRSLHAATESKSNRADEYDLLHHRNISVRSDAARFSGIAPTKHSSSPDVDDKHDKRLSIPKVGTAERVSISRVSSASSLRSIETSTPPRRKSPATRRVSHTGSPIQRKRSTGLREISPNTMTPSRQPSTATEDSTHSSNGNPFQWDNQNVNKPSALKGSPNARKGHRRQNCVRISTLKPQVLGPPPSRTNSPSIMHGIQEEGLHNDGSPVQTRFVTNSRVVRPSSSGSFRDNLRVQTLRASLTPSSPTLSLWAVSQDNGLPYDGSPRQSLPSPKRRNTSQSPTRSLPAYPSPGKTTVSTILREEGVPQFSLSRPSTDEPTPGSPTWNSDVEMPSSPPLPVSKEQPYDPAWSLPAPRQEYDPASPQWKAGSSPVFTLHDTSSAIPSPMNSSPVPCSPASMFDFNRIDSRKAALDTLTSANASTLMAKMSPPKVDFPGAPILSPVQYGSPPQMKLPGSTSSSRRRMVIPPSIPGISSDVSAPPSDISIPSPLHIRSPSLEQSPMPAFGSPGPQGPRDQPGKSVLTNALALRRMNSEVDNTRWSQKYVRMGREASPTLPWTSMMRTPGDASSSIFDYDGSEASFNGTETDIEDSRRKVTFGTFVFGSSPPAMPFQIDNRSTEEIDVFVDSPKKDDVAQFAFPSPEKTESESKVLPRNESLPRQSSSGAGISKRRKKSSPRQAAKMATPRSILKKMPFLLSDSSDENEEDKENSNKKRHLNVEATPNRAKSRTSLYDSDGFLRT